MLPIATTNPRFLPGSLETGKYARELPLLEAVERAITECIREGILKEFLEKNRAEVKKMSIYEYDQEKHIRMERQDAWEDGVLRGAEQQLSKIIKNMMKKEEVSPR